MKRRGPVDTDENSLSGSDSLSSDDSLDDDIDTYPPSGGEHTGGTSLGNDHAEKYGIGASIMTQMGYREGSGLGVDGKGIVRPIEVERRSKNAGIGAYDASSSDVVSPLTQNPSESKVSTRLAAIDEELQLLRKVDTILTGPLDPFAFFKEFRNTPVWDNMRLYEVFALVLVEQLKPLSLNEYGAALVSIEAYLDALPPRQWSSVLETTWLSQIVENFPLSLSTALEQWRDFRALRLVELSFAEALASNHGVLLTMLRTPGILQSLIETMPDGTQIIEEGYGELLDSKWSQALTLDDKKGIIRSFPHTSLATLLVRDFLGNDPFKGLEVLRDYRNDISDSSMSTLLRKVVMPRWLRSLVTELKGGNDIVLDIWLRHRASIVWCEDIVKDWLTSGLNAINTLLDTGSLGVLDDNPSQRLAHVESTFKDVLAHYCVKKGWGIEPRPSGYIVRGPHHLVTCFIDQDVLWVKSGHSSFPIALDNLQAYL